MRSQREIMPSSLVLRRARIEEFSHGARNLRGRVATAWSLAHGQWFMGSTYPGRRAATAHRSGRWRSACEIDLDFVAVTTAGAGLNKCVYAPEEVMRSQCPFMSETSRNVVPIDSGPGSMRD
jgi:hypothetical protein